MITIAASVFGAAITDIGSDVVNSGFQPDKITYDELREFFSEHRALLQDIADQLIPLREEINLNQIIRIDSQIVATNSNGEPVVLSQQLIQQFELYFDAVGSHNNPRVLVSELYGEYLIIEFSFVLRGPGIIIGLLYSPELDDEGEHLEGNWYVVDWGLPSPPIEHCWYTRLPNWLHWVFRWVFFGWAWMCC